MKLNRLQVMALMEAFGQPNRSTRNYCLEKFFDLVIHDVPPEGDRAIYVRSCGRGGEGKCEASILLTENLDVIWSLFLDVVARESRPLKEALSARCSLFFVDRHEGWLVFGVKVKRDEPSCYKYIKSKLNCLVSCFEYISSSSVKIHLEDGDPGSHPAGEPFAYVTGPIMHRDDETVHPPAGLL